MFLREDKYLDGKLICRISDCNHVKVEVNVS